jgi:D-serine deaminase-like pyridoxal phosphate-dependent protein
MPDDAVLRTALVQVLARPWQAVVLERPQPLAALPTPALLLDVDAFERNLQHMATYLKERGKGFRPHAKTHKCPLIAARQLQAGAVGICTAKISEAAVMVNAGIDRVLITSPVVSPEKIRLVVELAAQASQLDVVVDSWMGFAALEAAADPTAPLGVLVDVDIAMGRTGNRDLDQVVRLAEAVAATDGLQFRGIQHYAGHLMHVKGHARRREKSLALWEAVRQMVQALADRGLPPTVVTGGGTGTYDIDVEVAEITDLQVGSYLFMDQEYRLIGGRDGDWFDDFEVSLQVAATAISQPRDGTITVDGGFKSFASDSVNPEPLTLPDSEYRFAGDEHGVLLLGAPTQEPLLGTVQRFITPHCDPTVNLYDWYWLCRDGMATELWPIAARGCSW